MDQVRPVEQIAMQIRDENFASLCVYLVSAAGDSGHTYGAPWRFGSAKTPLRAFVTHKNTPDMPGYFYERGR